MVRRHLESKVPDHDAGYLLRPFILCCVPVRKPPKAAGEWSRRYGAAEFRVIPDSKVGSPGGQDRILLLLAARAAIEQQRRQINLGTASQILKTLGLPPDGRNYTRLEQRFRRLLGARMTCTYWQKVDGKVSVARVSEIYIEDSHLWFQPRRKKAAPARFRNSLTLSEGFWDEVRRNPAFVDLAVVRRLLNAPGVLAFYFWLCLCSHTAWPDHVTRIPIHGPLGLKRRLGITGYSQQRDFSRHARRWLKAVQDLWDECPATLSEDGTALEVTNNNPRVPNVDRA